MKIRTMIVDDEPLARDVLRMMLVKHPQIELVAECKGGREAIQRIDEDPPDLLFLDVQMPEVDGFAVLQEIGIDRVPILIFVTAYDHYALKAFEAHALDYLLKPFDKKRLDQTLARALERLHQQHNSKAQIDIERLLNQVRDRDNTSERLTLKSDGKMTVVRQADIERVEAAGDYVQIHLSGRKLLVHQTLSGILQRLDGRIFTRIHRSHIVNIDCVQSLEPIFNGDYQIELESGTRLKLSRTYRDAVLRLLGIDS